MTAICPEAGLTERYFYESFANRDAALVAALEARHRGDRRAARGSCSRRHPARAEERVHAMTASFADWVGRPARPRRWWPWCTPARPPVCGRGATS